jgi:hypothetical protein
VGSFSDQSKIQVTSFAVIQVSEIFRRPVCGGYIFIHPDVQNRAALLSANFIANEYKIIEEY